MGIYYDLLNMFCDSDDIHFTCYRRVMMRTLIGIILFVVLGNIYADGVVSACDELGNCTTGVVIDINPPNNWPFKDVPAPQ